jgi:hypothetical protein
VELYLHFSDTPSWRGAQLKKHRGNFTFYPFYVLAKRMTPGGVKEGYLSLYFSYNLPKIHVIVNVNSPQLPLWYM